MSIYLQV